MNTIAIRKELIVWARQRAGFEVDDLIKPFPKLVEWEQGTSSPTMKQLETLAKRLWAPLGYFFLPAPPEEKLPIPDFRSVNDTPVQHPSPNLLETVFSMQQRQAWFKDFIVEEGAEPLNFVGSATLKLNPANVAADIRKTIGIAPNWAASVSTWTDALIDLGIKAEQVGILAIWNGVVANNTRRPLDVEEFRGFVLIDSYAPLIFINNADAKGAQMFTFAHELAHIWIGSAGVLNFRNLEPADNETEKFCNQVAAEFLIPKIELIPAWGKLKSRPMPFEALSRQFKVSPVVAARRVLDIGQISKKDFFDFYNAYIQSERDKKAAKKAAEESGGDFYANCDYRIGRPFAEAISRAAKSGKLLYRDAYRLTGLQGSTLDKYVQIISKGVG
jgi:Zn-dependent peptidase ImmA (M78 family)/transcriptional regulator with XRE-family HTH domain